MSSTPAPSDGAHRARAPRAAALLGCVIALAWAALSGCKTDEGAARADSPPATAALSAAPATSAHATAPTGEGGGLQHAGPKHATLSVPAQGTSRVAVSGCAQAGQGDDQDGARFPAPPEGSRSTGGAKPQDVRVSVMGDGLIMSHTLNHACCLKAEVNVTTSADAVVIQEVLSGEPCRCRCQSTLEAAVGLPLGDYTLTVETVTRDSGIAGAQVVHKQPVQVKSLLGAPATPKDNP